MREEPIDRYGRSVYQVGTRQMIDLVPYVPEDTEFIPAGPISVGVAACDIYRSAGVTFHVIGTEDRLERLRFDCLGADPHYHYIFPGAGNLVVPFDSAASGDDMVAWAIDAMERRMPSLLERAGASQLAAAVNAQVLKDALAELRAVTERVLRDGPANRRERCMDGERVAEVTIKTMPNGPYLVQGDMAEVVDVDGNTLLCRTVMALCRCGGSKKKPFCDGSHIEVGFVSEPRVPGEEQELT